MFDFTKEDAEAAPVVPFSQRNCTIISLVPYVIRELKPALIPGFFQIPRSVNGVPSLLHVGESIHWLESPFPKGQPIKMTETSISMARSICADFIEGQIALDSDSAPGIFWQEGHLSLNDVLKDASCQEKLTIAKKHQDNWFLSLIRMADDDWSKNRQHGVVSNLQRHAALALGINRDWLDVTREAIMARCPLCSELVSENAVVHSACGYIIKPELYAKMKGNIVAKELVAK